MPQNSIMNKIILTYRVIDIDGPSHSGDTLVHPNLFMTMKYANIDHNIEIDLGQTDNFYISRGTAEAFLDVNFTIYNKTNITKFPFIIVRKGVDLSVTFKSSIQVNYAWGVC